MPHSRDTLSSVTKAPLTEGGFTLIEMLVVIAIILTLISIALPNYTDAQYRAKVARAKADMRTVGIAVEQYFIDWGMYPPDQVPKLGTDENGLFQLTTPLTYLQELPQDIFDMGNSGMEVNPAGAIDRWFEFASTGVPPSLVNFLRPITNAYAIYSTGPDISDNFNDPLNWPYDDETPPCPTKLGFVNYSPTNGTRSGGDLVLLGGEFKSGYYCVDGWKVINGSRKIYR